MIDWIGASEWYDTKLQQAEKASPLTKRGAPRKRLATVVLDKYLKETSDDTAAVGPKDLASKDHEHAPLSFGSTVIKKMFHIRRKRLIDIFHKGRTLRRLIQITDLGILFDPNIRYVVQLICLEAFTDRARRYAKASKEDVDNIAALLKGDAQKMKLLAILGDQVELVANNGRPDLSRFLDLLKSHSIISAGEASRLRADYGLEKVSRRLTKSAYIHLNAITGTCTPRILEYCSRSSFGNNQRRSWRAAAWPRPLCFC
jgi:hypothetical protein